MNTARLTRGLVNVGLEIWLPIVMLAVWWVVSADSTSVYFPPLSTILTSFAHDFLTPTGFVDNLLPSLGVLGAGYGSAVVAGVVIGMLLGLIRPLEAATRPLLELLRAVPGVSLLPIFVVLFGIDNQMKIILIAFGAFWPVLLNTIDGERGVEPLLFDFARSYGLSPLQRLIYVALPGASPQIFAGARTALAISLIIMVVGETVGSNGGLGYFLLSAQRNFAIGNMWGAIVALGVLGYVLSILFRIIERIVLRWHRLQQARLENAR